jgi:hypothetical protein
MRDTIIDYVRNERYSELSFLIFNHLFAADTENYQENLDYYINNSNFIDFTEMICRNNFTSGMSDESIIQIYNLVVGLVFGGIQFGLIK